MVEGYNPMMDPSDGFFDRAARQAAAAPLTEGAVIYWLEQQPPEVRKRIIDNFCCLCGNEVIKCHCIQLARSTAK